MTVNLRKSKIVVGGGLPPNMAFNLPEKLVVRVLCYGFEIWGYERPENIARSHNNSCKGILGVSYNALFHKVSQVLVNIIVHE